MSILHQLLTLPADPIAGEDEPYTIYDALVEALEEVLGLDFEAESPLPPEPTNYPPASPEKIEVMRLRMEHRQVLHHPRDCPSLEGMHFDRAGNGYATSPKLKG